MFLLVPAHPGSPGQRAIKRLLLLLLILSHNTSPVSLRVHQSELFSTISACRNCFVCAYDACSVSEHLSCYFFILLSALPLIIG